jgi:hypothetical protein
MYPYVAELAWDALHVVVRATAEAVFVAVVLAVVDSYGSSWKEIEKKGTLLRNWGQVRKSQFPCELSTDLLDTAAHERHTIGAVSDFRSRRNCSDAPDARYWMLARLCSVWGSNQLAGFL